MSIKKIIVEMIAVVSIFSLLISICGCSTKRNADDKNDNKSETRNFSSYSQEERKLYITDVLKDKRNFICCSVSDVLQRQETVFKNEQYYYATVRNEDNDLVFVWVDKDGNVYDTVFCLDLKEKMNSTLLEIISKYEKNCVVSSYIEFENAPKKEWYPTDNMSEMLQSEDIYLFVRVFIDETNTTDMALFAEKIAKELSFCNGVIRIYKHKGIEDIQIESIDLTSYSYSRELSKG